MKGFTRVIYIEPGLEKTATITFSKDDLAYWDPGSKKWTVTPGTYTIWVGSSSRELPLHVELKL